VIIAEKRIFWVTYGKKLLLKLDKMTEIEGIFAIFECDFGIFAFWGLQKFAFFSLFATIFCFFAGN